jgi:hypothetical protein
VLLCEILLVVAMASESIGVTEASRSVLIPSPSISLAGVAI